MDNWINEPGYPVITVTRDATASNIINIKQERFFLVKPSEVNKIEWYIPINYVTQELPETIMPKEEKYRWMKPGKETAFEKLNNEQWILFNKDQTGMY